MFGGQCVSWLLFLLFSKSNQLPNNSIQTLAARAMDKDMDMAQRPPTHSTPSPLAMSCHGLHKEKYIRDSNWGKMGQENGIALYKKYGEKSNRAGNTIYSPLKLVKYFIIV